MTHRIDPEQAAATAARDALAATLPPVTLTEPFGPSRVINDRLAMIYGQGGPVMAETTEHWLLIRGRRIQFRVHKPTLGTALPVLVWFHGGGWVFQSIDSHDRLIREFAAAAGCATVSVAYSLAPESRFPQPLLECADAVRALADTDWGLDTTRIALGGDSAGGNLALATAIHLRDAGGPGVRAVLTPAPVTDADFTSPSYEEFAEGFGLTRAGMQAYWDLYTRDHADRLNPLAAPLRADCRGGARRDAALLGMGRRTASRRSRRDGRASRWHALHLSVSRASLLRAASRRRAARRTDRRRQQGPALHAALGRASHSHDRAAPDGHNGVSRSTAAARVSGLARRTAVPTRLSPDAIRGDQREHT